MCDSDLPDCCQGGWKVTLVGSRFLHGAEQRYAAVEGEAQAVEWGLEQTKYFTQGCDDLIVVTDHKPLVKLLGDRTLDEISNTRLFMIMQRTLPWRFKVLHMPRKANHAAGAASRHPSSGSSGKANLHLLTANDLDEVVFNAALLPYASDFMSISWQEIVKASQSDDVLIVLRNLVNEGS